MIDSCSVCVSCDTQFTARFGNRASRRVTAIIAGVSAEDGVCFCTCTVTLVHEVMRTPLNDL